MRRVSRDQYQSLERYVELVGGDLGDGGLDALTELDLAAPHRHRAVGVEAHPAIQPGCDFEALRQRHAVRGEAGCRIARAAARIARKIRTCVPQRQRLRSSAAAISASLGSLFRRRSARAAMMMPSMQ